MKKRRQFGFTLLEFIIAVCVLSIAMSALYKVVQGTVKLKRMSHAEQQALVVLGNVLERYRAEDDPGQARAAILLSEEFNASPLAADKSFSAKCEKLNKMVRVRVNRNDGKPIALLDITS